MLVGIETLGAASPDAGAVSKRAPRFRYVFDSGAGVAAAASGWNLLDVDSKTRADRLPRGARALVWVGDYDNSTCSWSVSDAALEQEVASMANDPKVAGYFFSDEPDPFACPQAPAQHRARSRLVHANDPHALTVMVADSNSGNASLTQIPLWAGAADYVGLNPYVCYRSRACNFAWLDKIIRAADRARLRYWGVVQAFGDAEWRWPTPREERRMLARWAASNQRGYMTFAWRWAGHTLSSHANLLRVLEHFNGASRP